MSFPMSLSKKESIVKRLTAALISGLASLFIAPYPTVAQSPETTASEVVDRETLQAFVEGARAWSETFTDPNDFAPYTIALSTEGDWKHGNTYLILMQPNGTVFFHAHNPSTNGKDLNDIEDDRGNKVVQALIEAANAGGGFIQYNFDDPAVTGDEDTGSPKVSYAELFTFRDQDYVFGAGLYTGAAATAVEGQSWGQLKSDF